jgi:hypothetical protein
MDDLPDNPRKAMHVARERSVHEAEKNDPTNYISED